MAEGFLVDATHALEFDRAFREFVPQRTAVLGIVRTKARVLLIRKKRGLGKGKLVAPGGHVEGGETPTAACVRELQEELHITPLFPDSRGVVDFQFRSGLSMRVHVFLADSFEGTETETEEAAPVWCEEASLPYDEMWQDDPLWLPHVLRGSHVYGRFLFDDDAMLYGDVAIAAEPFTF